MGGLQSCKTRLNFTATRKNGAKIKSGGKPPLHQAPRLLSLRSGAGLKKGFPHLGGQPQTALSKPCRTSPKLLPQILVNQPKTLSPDTVEPTPDSPKSCKTNPKLPSPNPAEKPQTPFLKHCRTNSKLLPRSCRTNPKLLPQILLKKPQTPFPDTAEPWSHKPQAGSKSQSGTFVSSSL